MHGADLICVTGFSCDYQDDFGWKPELKKKSFKKKLYKGEGDKKSEDAIL